LFTRSLVPRSGAPTHCELLRFDPAHQLRWTRQFPRDYRHCTYAVGLTDGGVLHVESDHLVRLDSNGAVSWQTALGAEGWLPYAVNTLSVDSGGRAHVGGVAAIDGATRGYVTSIAADTGGVITRHSYQSPGHYFTLAVRHLTDGSIDLLSNGDIGSGKSLLLRLRLAAGASQWVEQPVVLKHGVIHGALASAAGFVVLVGPNWQPVDGLVMLDDSGERWYQPLPPPAPGSAYVPMRTAVADSGQIAISYNGTLHRYDQDGAVLPTIAVPSTGLAYAGEGTLWSVDPGSQPVPFAARPALLAIGADAAQPQIRTGLDVVQVGAQLVEAQAHADGSISVLSQSLSEGRLFAQTVNATGVVTQSVDRGWSDLPIMTAQRVIGGWLVIGKIPAVSNSARLSALGEDGALLWQREIYGGEAQLYCDGLSICEMLSGLNYRQRERFAFDGATLYSELLPHGYIGLGHGADSTQIQLAQFRENDVLLSRLTNGAPIPIARVPHNPSGSLSARVAGQWLLPGGRGELGLFGDGIALWTRTIPVDSLVHPTQSGQLRLLHTSNYGPPYTLEHLASADGSVISNTPLPAELGDPIRIQSERASYFNPYFGSGSPASASPELDWLVMRVYESGQQALLALRPQQLPARFVLPVTQRTAAMRALPGRQDAVVLLHDDSADASPRLALTRYEMELFSDGLED
jgi:hypothetical protein